MQTGALGLSNFCGLEWRKVFMRFALLIALVLLALGTIAFFIIRPWLPAGISLASAAVDRQFAVALAAIGIAFLVSQAALAFIVWRGRSHQLPASLPDASGIWRWELLWLLVTAVFFAGLAWSGAASWQAANAQAATRQAPIDVEVTGTQFAWYFRYPGGDGKFGRTLPQFIDPAQGNAAAIGLDANDPASADDVVTQILVLPQNQPAELRLRSHDVIHSFFVPELRFKQDAVPGLENSLRFLPLRVGDYELVCAQLCGLGHYRMRSRVRIVSQKEFAAWMTEQSAKLQARSAAR